MILFIAFGIFIGFLLLIWMLVEAQQNNLVKYNLNFTDFPKELSSLTIFFISDIHRRKISDDLIYKIKDKTQLIVIGGDLVEQGVPITRVRDNLKKLTSIAPVYFVWGNHDHEYDKERLVSELVNQNIHILENNSFEFKPNVYLIGVDDSTYDRDNLPRAIKNCPRSGFYILLSHNPNIRDRLPLSHKISLVLSGHTHGGQIRFGRFGIRELGGIKQIKNGILIISNGYGTTRYPLRFGAPPDTLLITVSHL